MTIIIDFIRLGIPLLPTILIIIYSHQKAKERKKIYEKILKSKEKIFTQGHWFHIKYCSEKRFWKYWKLFPWEAAGILYLSKDNVMFFGEASSKRNLEVKFDSNNFDVKWIGRKIRNGATSWLVITIQGGKHYFTSETGAFVFGSKITTMHIYKELKDFYSSDKVV